MTLVPIDKSPTSTFKRHPLDELCINTIHTLAIDAIQAAYSGYPGAPMAMAPVAYCGAGLGRAGIGFRLVEIRRSEGRVHRHAVLADACPRWPSSRIKFRSAGTARSRSPGTAPYDRFDWAHPPSRPIRYSQ
jgi:hypothetical protein